MEYVNAYKPDYIGFVFAKSKRQIDGKKARELKKALDPSILSVGVFVNEPIENIIGLCGENIINMVQLHGEEPVSYAKALSKRIKQPIIRAVRIKELFREEEFADDPCDYYLFDSYTKDSYGGSGKTFPKEFIRDVKKPYFLAGGITTQNVWEELHECHPYCVDISSGVEKNGFKDKDKIKEFIEAVRK